MQVPTCCSFSPGSGGEGTAPCHHPGALQPSRAAFLRLMLTLVHNLFNKPSPTLPDVSVLWFPAGILIRLEGKFGDSQDRKVGSGPQKGGEVPKTGCVASSAVCVRVS